MGKREGPLYSGGDSTTVVLFSVTDLLLPRQGQTSTKHGLHLGEHNNEECIEYLPSDK